jgi:hypothetical protein
MLSFPSADPRSLADAPRLAVRLLCTLHLPGRDLRAASTNLSYSGIGIVLPKSGPDPHLIEAVTLDGVGRLETRFRWHRWNRAGLAFRNRSSVRPLLNTYFRSIGDYPV